MGAGSCRRAQAPRQRREREQLAERGAGRICDDVEHVRLARRGEHALRDLDANGLADVWRYEILPLLAEHHYGDGVDLEARYGLAALRRQATPSIADGAEGAHTAG